ncbi:hypothetical protein ABW20_dc0101153 [Dactylellina cionopaga]|nr:hypothetical protein ABW20_dc0101153 [Dactylellina cionopaga]
MYNTPYLTATPTKVLIRPGLKSDPDRNIINNNNNNHHDDIVDSNRAPWRQGGMTPQGTSWYEWLIPETIRRRRNEQDLFDHPVLDDEGKLNIPGKNQYGDAVLGFRDEECRTEEERRSELIELYGDVDSGHCADSQHWKEDSACMCSITTRMPGRYPHAFCETTQRGFLVRTIHDMNHECLDLEEEELGGDGIPCWLFQPVSEEPATRLCWERNYNSQLKRHEYVAKERRGEPAASTVASTPAASVVGLAVAPQQLEYVANDDDYENDGKEFSSLDIGTPECNIPQNVSCERHEEPFTCSRKPPWLQHVRRFVRAEELEAPPSPSSDFVSKTGRMIGRFDPEFFKVPYYDAEYRGFRYTDGTTDMSKLRLKFNLNAPPPKPVVPRKEKPLVKRLMAIPKVDEPIVHPNFKPDPGKQWHFPEVIKVLERPRQSSFIRPPIEKPRYVVFPHSPEEPDDTPCPPPRRWLGRPVPKTRRVKSEFDGGYLPSESPQSEEDIGMLEKTKLSLPGVPKKKHRKRRRKNSDPTYKQHGVRENNKIEKEDLKKMQKEKVGYSDEADEFETPKKPVIKGIRKHFTRKGKVEKKKVTFLEPSHKIAPHPNKGRLRRGSNDGEYVLFRNREEEERERQDIRNMKTQVDRNAEGDPEPIASDTDDESEKYQSVARRVSKTVSTTSRRRVPPEDRAYRPGKRLFA